MMFRLKKINFYFEIDHFCHHLCCRKTKIECKELNQQRKDQNFINELIYFTKEWRIGRSLYTGESFLIINLNTNIRIDLFSKKISSLYNMNHNLPFFDLINISLISSQTKTIERTNQQERTFLPTFSRVIQDY